MQGEGAKEATIVSRAGKPAMHRPTAPNPVILRSASATTLHSAASASASTPRPAAGHTLYRQQTNLLMSLRACIPYSLHHPPLLACIALLALAVLASADADDLTLRAAIAAIPDI